MLKFIYLISFVLCFLSCKESIDSSHRILKVSLYNKDSESKIEDIFKKIEIISLEASNESSMKAIRKIKIKNDTLYIFDSYSKALYLFSTNGQYLQKIHRIGKSREEYLHLSDFEIDRKTGNMLLLDPTGWINEYSVNGKFIKKHKLPKPPYNYHRITMLDSVYYAFWSTSNDKENVINFLNINTKKITNGYLRNSSVWGSFKMDGVFHKYNNDIYYNEALCGKVYKITPKGYDIAYEWDFGLDPISKYRLLKPIKNREDHMRINQDYRDGKIPFSYSIQLQSNKYYCTTIIENTKLLKTYLYDKQTKEYKIITEDNGVMRIIPKFMNDEYMLGVINSRNPKLLKEYIIEKNYTTIGNIDNVGNPLLIKMYFK